MDRQGSPESIQNTQVQVLDALSRVTESSPFAYFYSCCYFLYIV